MDINTKIKDFISYAKEVCLQNLFWADNIKVDLKNQDNLYEVERIELKGNSGAEVVEKFFKYKIKELKKIKGDLLQKLNKLLDKEEKLNLDLSNAIQEVEQLEIIEKLQPVRAEFRNLSLQLDKYQKELEETENKFFKKWYYEIYGTTDKEVLLKAYNSQ